MSLRFAAPLGILALLGSGCGPEPRGSTPPNVVLITLESLRTDYVGAYGGGISSRPDLPVTPELDRFAAQATVYEDAHSVTSWTLAAHASLFTGLYPVGHQTDGPRDRLDDAIPTLAEALGEQGYQTAGVVSGPYLRRTHNLHQGFEHWDESAASLTSALAHDDVTNPAMQAGLRRFLEEERDPGRPFLLFAYYWDPHFDFLPPAPYDEMFAGPGAEPVDLRGFDTSPAIHAALPAAQLDYVLSRYAGELRWTDFHLGRLFRTLRELGLWDDSIVIVTADHGEEFFDHGEKGHKKNLYAETTRVPLIVKLPGQREGRRDGRLVSLVDLLPTLLELSGSTAQLPLHGRSLLADPDPERSLLYELRALQYYRTPDGSVGSTGERWYAVREGDWRLVWHGPEGEDPFGSQTTELFDLAKDPTEQVDLSKQEPERLEALRQRFGRELDRARQQAALYPRGGPAELTPAEVEQLRELGYLGP